MNGGRRTALENTLPGAVATAFSAGWLARKKGTKRENFVLASVSTSTGPSCSTLRCFGTSSPMPGHAPWMRSGRACTTSPPPSVAASGCVASNCSRAASSCQNAMRPTRPGEGRAGVVPNLAAMSSVGLQQSWDRRRTWVPDQAKRLPQANVGDVDGDDGHRVLLCVGHLGDQCAGPDGNRHRRGRWPAPPNGGSGTRHIATSSGDSGR